MDLNFILSRWTLKLFELSLVILAAGNLYFSWIINDHKSNFINIIALLAAGGYAVLVNLLPRFLEVKICARY
jgi:hypothetical protein